MADDKKPPRRLHMGDMLRSTRPDPAFHDTLDTPDPPKPAPEPDYSDLSPERREVMEYRDEHGCSLNEAMRAVRARHDEQDRHNKWADLQAQLSCAKSVEELKPILGEIIDKLWS